MNLLGYLLSSTELRAAMDEHSPITLRLHEYLKNVYPRGVNGGETVDANCHECGLMKERSRRSVTLEHLSKIEFPATCSGVVVSLSRARTGEGRWRGV
jgi:hypothetical protein